MHNRFPTWMKLAFVAAVLPAGAARAQDSLTSSHGALTVTEMAAGLDEPWALAFLPDGRFLVTEREGRLTLFAAEGGAGTAIGGLPEVAADGQGGLLDVMIPADFDTSREVWLSFAGRVAGGAGTVVGKGRLSEDATMIEGFAPLYEGDGVGGGRHFGSRIIEAPDGTVFLTTGDRGTGPDGLEAQDPGLSIGKIVHLNRDGTPATARDGWRPGVYSLGHRNAQGAAIGPDGALWTVEHGAQGGDEVNRVREGANYGWPVITYGENYGGGQIGVGTAQEGLEQPLHYWDPSIAPSGMIFYQGDMFPDWQGDILFGSLNSDFLGRLDPDTPAETGFAEERLQSDRTGRVRDVVEAGDGAIWYLSVYDGAVYRLSRQPSG